MKDDVGNDRSGTRQYILVFTVRSTRMLSHKRKPFFVRNTEKQLVTQLSYSDSVWHVTVEVKVVTHQLHGVREN